MCTKYINWKYIIFFNSIRLRCAKTFHAPSLLIFFLYWKKKYYKTLQHPTMQIFKNITTDTIFGGTSSRPILMPMTASWKSFVAGGAGFDAVGNTFCWPPYVYDWNACQLPLGGCSLLYFLLLFCCCCGWWIFYECFKKQTYHRWLF